MVFNVNMQKYEIYFWIRHVVCGPWYVTHNTHSDMHTFVLLSLKGLSIDTIVNAAN